MLASDVNGALKHNFLEIPTWKYETNLYVDPDGVFGVKNPVEYI